MFRYYNMPQSVTALQHTAYKTSSKSDYISLKYGNRTILTMAVVHHFEFAKFAICGIWPRLYSM